MRRWAERLEVVPVSLTVIPVIAEPGILEQCIAIAITRVGSAHLLKYVQVAVVVQVGKGNRVALLQVPESTGHGHIGEAISAAIVEHQMGTRLS